MFRKEMKVYSTSDRNQRRNVKGLIGLVFVTALRCKNIGEVCFQRKAFDWWIIDCFCRNDNGRK